MDLAIRKKGHRVEGRATTKAGTAPAKFVSLAVK